MAMKSNERSRRTPVELQGVGGQGQGDTLSKERVVKKRPSIFKASDYPNRDYRGETKRNGVKYRV
jgi:hypothetical protein